MEDYIVRATAADGQIRAFAAYTRECVETARAAHNTSPVATAALGRMLTASAMMGSMMKGDTDMLTVIVDGDGPIGKITVTADSKGNVKGYVTEPMVLIHAKSNGKLDVSGAVGHGTLKVIRDMGMKEPYVGQTELISGELAEDLTYYYALSEQIPSGVGLGVLMDKNNTVAQAGGFFIQLMPFASDEIISALEQRLAQVKSVTAMLSEGMTPEDILGMLLEGMDLQILDRMPTRFYCNCSEGKYNRAYKAVMALEAKEIEEMIADGEPIQVHCHFCNSDIELSIDDLKDILEAKTLHVKMYS